jgi:hypothetical protein
MKIVVSNGIQSTQPIVGPISGQELLDYMHRGDTSGKSFIVEFSPEEMAAEDQIQQDLDKARRAYERAKMEAIARSIETGPVNPYLQDGNGRWMTREEAAKAFRDGTFDGRR